MTFLTSSGHRWQRSQASGAQDSAAGHGQALLALDPAASGVSLRRSRESNLAVTGSEFPLPWPGGSRRRPTA